MIQRVHINEHKCTSLLGIFHQKNLQVLLKSFVNNYIKLLLEGMGSHRSQFSKYSLRKFMNNLNMYGLCRYMLLLSNFLIAQFKLTY